MAINKFSGAIRKHLLKFYQPPPHSPRSGLRIGALVCPLCANSLHN